MTSQERFWQARLLSKEAEYRTQLTAIHQQLEALKDTTNHAKADLENHSTQELIKPTPTIKNVVKNKDFDVTHDNVDEVDEVIFFTYAMYQCSTQLALLFL